MVENYLIIFVKNLIPGQVKTRLAKDIGIDRALDVYMELVNHTHNEVIHLNVSKNVFYSDYVEVGDVWDHEEINYHVQKGVGLGERMHHAFDQAFKDGGKKAIIIGSDCYELKKKHIEWAFERLNENDLVIGPAEDGGFYLLGMKSPHPQLFENKTYSHEHVFNHLVEAAQKEDLTFELLDPLSDVDELADIKGTPLEKMLADDDAE